MKMTEEATATQVTWVLSYVQGGIVEVWKDNLLDELAITNGHLLICDCLV